MTGVLIIGAGPAGLGAAHELASRGIDFEIVERADKPGGLAVTDLVGRYLFDRTGHFLHMRSPAFRELVESSGVPMETIARRSAVVIGEAIVPYPIQYNLWALPEPVRRSIAREVADRSLGQGQDDDGSLARALRDAWGPTLFESFFRPYNEKLLGRPLEEVPRDCLGRFVPAIDDEMLRRGCEGPVTGTGYNATFSYPASGRIGDLFRALAAPHRDRINCGESVESIDAPGRRARTTRRTIEFRSVISTLSLGDLVGRVSPTVFAGDATGLRAATVRNVRVGFRGRMLRDEHWIYAPDERMPFYRIGFPANICDATCPPGCASLSIECGIRHPGDRERPAPDIARSAIEFAVARGLVEHEATEVIDEVAICPAYVIDRGCAEATGLHRALRGHGIHCAGRYGSWQYFSMEDSFLDGMRAAREAVLDGAELACRP